MKKFSEFLEKNVQWLVLGLGVVYLLYMAWSYIIFPPVKVAGIDPEKPLPPGEVDQKIYEQVAQPLEGKMKEGKPPKMEVPNFVENFKKDMDKQDAKPLEYVQNWLPPSSSSELTPPTVPGQPNVPGQTNQGVAKSGTITELPALLAAQLKDVKSGMSSVLQPVPPDANNPDQGGAVQATGVDKSWVTVRYEIDPKEFVKEWDRLKIPQGTVNTTFLQIVLERQELQGNGNWSEPTPVAMLGLQQQTNPPPPPFPADDAPAQDKWLYLQWASSHQVDILQPAFYQVAKGDQWTIPGEAAAPPPDQQQFDPNQFVDFTAAQIQAHQPPFTNDQKRQIYQAKTKRDQDRAKGSRQSRPAPGARPPRGPYGPGGPGGGGYGGEEPGMGPNDQARPAAGGPYAPPRPGAYGPGGYGPGGYGPGGGYPPPGAYPGYGARPYDPEMEGETGNVPPPSANFPIPTSEFDPHQWVKQNPDKNIVGWAHDETVVPGHTYRYRVTYKLKNPIFFAINVAKDPKLTQIFAIASKPSEWSQNVEVRSTIVFYVAKASMSGSDKVSLQVFRWQNGTANTETFDVLPGDSVGLKKGDIDYSTGWTLVGVGKDRDDAYVLLMDQSGTMHRRNVKDDMNDANYKQLKDQANAANASASAAGPGR